MKLGSYPVETPTFELRAQISGQVQDLIRSDQADKRCQLKVELRTFIIIIFFHTALYYFFVSTCITFTPVVLYFINVLRMHR